MLSAALVLALLGGAAWWIGGERSAVGAGRGDPDPGGVRIAAIRAVAAKLLPPTVSHVASTVDGFRWGTGGCDGGPAGWTLAQVDVTFDAPADLPALIGRQLSSAGWQVRAVPTDVAGQPPSVQDPNAGTTYVPIGVNPYGELAVLTPQDGGAPGTWDLWVSADPAVNPDHDC